MNIAAVNQFIGLDWSYPDNYCWSVVRDASAAIFGRSITEVKIPDEFSADENAKLFDAGASSSEWREIDTPTNGCIVLCRNRSWRAVHVGLHVEGGNVLHCRGSAEMPGRTAYDSLVLLDRMYKHLGYYEFAPDTYNQ